jgi:hypothetical protein
MQGILRANVPISMIPRRSEILAYIAAGKSKTWIARNCGHGRDLIHQIRVAVEEDTSQIYALDDSIGAPTKFLPDVMELINELAAANRQISSGVLAQIIGATPGAPSCHVRVSIGLIIDSATNLCHQL